jgi:mono/diheme cytochrome c family protein
MRLRAAAILAAGLLAAVAAGCGGGDEETASPDTVEGTVPTETNGGETTAPPGEGDAAAGADVFAEAGCGGCHVLEAAGSSGSVGPNLDDSQPSFDLAVDRVTNGSGAMPSFSGQLSEEDIQNVAAYVVESTGGG